MPNRLRWLIILVPVAAIGLIEVLADSVLDPYLPFPGDTVVVMAAVLVAWALLARVAFRRIDALTGALAARNAELERRIAAARALHRVSVSIAAADDIESVFRMLVGEARELLEADAAVLLLAGADGEPRFVAGDGEAGAFDPTGRQPGADAMRFVDPAAGRAQLAAPLQRGGETIGLLFVGCRTERTFGIDDVETLASLANEAALAVENARLQARLRELAVVAERERIAREMHDGLAQILGYVNTKSQAVETLLAVGRTAEARQHLAELAGAARSLYVDVREAILGLRSPITPELGLVGAIETYAERFAEASKLAVAVTATEAARRASLPADVEAQVFRVVQESLTNVRKHAAARRVGIDVALVQDRLVVVLADDGRGFEQGGIGHEIADREIADGEWPRYGLQAMRERAAEAGGSIEWQRGPDGGSIVRLEVPAAGGGGAVRTPVEAG